MADETDLTETQSEETELDETELTAADVLNAQQYQVCGVVVDASFTYDELSEWRDFSKAKGLSGIESRLVKLGNAAQQEVRTKGRYETQEKLVKALSKSIDNKLLKMENDPDSWTEDDANALDRASERLDAERAKLDSLEADPESVIGIAERHIEQIDQLQFDRRILCLEFVHKLATDRRQTKHKFATWKKRAKGQDLVNASQVVRSGNAAWTTTAQARRHFQPKPRSQLN